MQVIEEHPDQYEAYVNNVLFQSDQLVDLAGNRRFGQNAGRFLEGCGRDKRLGLQRSLGNTEQYRVGLSRRPVLGNNLGVFRFKHITVNLLADEERCIARNGDFNFSQHLRNDNLNMLVVNLNALQTVNVLNFLNQIFSQFLNAQDTQNVMR